MLKSPLKCDIPVAEGLVAATIQKLQNLKRQNENPTVYSQTPQPFSPLDSHAVAFLSREESPIKSTPQNKIQRKPVASYVSNEDLRRLRHLDDTNRLLNKPSVISLRRESPAKTPSALRSRKDLRSTRVREDSNTPTASVPPVPANTPMDQMARGQTPSYRQNAVGAIVMLDSRKTSAHTKSNDGRQGESPPSSPKILLAGESSSRRILDSTAAWDDAIASSFEDPTSSPHRSTRSRSEVCTSDLSLSPIPTPNQTPSLRHIGPDVPVRSPTALRKPHKSVADSITEMIESAVEGRTTSSRSSATSPVLGPVAWKRVAEQGPPAWKRVNDVDPVAAGKPTRDVNEHDDVFGRPLAAPPAQASQQRRSSLSLHRLSWKGKRTGEGRSKPTWWRRKSHEVSSCQPEAYDGPASWTSRYDGQRLVYRSTWERGRSRIVLDVEEDEELDETNLRVRMLRARE